MLLALAIIFILGIINLIYRQTYTVSLNGQVIGYTKNKAELQEKINEYVKSGDGDGVAFVELSEMPVFTANLLKRNVQTNDNEIFSKSLMSKGICVFFTEK